MDSRMPDCVWPEWKFIKQIGRGSYGTVYEAVRRDEYGVESRAAIKVVSIPQNEAELDSLHSEGLDYTASRTYMRNVVDAFVNEVKLMITFKGVPNIVSVEDYKVVERQDEIGWDISIRMELLTSLSDYIADKTLTESEVAKIGIDICSALEVCEKKKVIHRDIKPANIFVNEFGDYKLGDFGIARQMQSMTTELSRKGTGSYMAPEVERGESYNATVDLYSLGLVLYFLLNKKRLPFLDLNKQILTPNDREQAIRRRLDGETLPAPCDASPAMARVILCSCAYDPRRRFFTAKAMKNALQSALNKPDTAGQKGKVETATPQSPSAGKPTQTAPAGKKAQTSSSGKSTQTAPAKKKTKTPPSGKSTQTAPAGKKPLVSPAGKGSSLKKRARSMRFWVILICVAAAAVVCVADGVYFSRRSKVKKYDNLVEQQEESREQGNAAMEEDLFNQAVALRPSELESYYQHARMLHDHMTESGEFDYAGCVNFIEENILRNDAIDQTDSRMADVYYLYGDSLFQRGDSSSAVDSYKEMDRIGTEDPSCYMDYAIALAADGNATRAQDMLDKAERLGLDEAGVYFVQAAMEAADEKYNAAVTDYNYCIQAASDEELIARAYLGIADIYRSQDNLTSERMILLDAEEIDSSRLPQILKRLIQTDVDWLRELSEVGYDTTYFQDYAREAVQCLHTLTENGWGTFDLYQEVIQLYLDLYGLDLSDAEEVLFSIKDQYEDDYRWYKLAAFLEYEKLRGQGDEDPDYSAFASYYNSALDLYDRYLEDGNDADSEMSDLQDLYKTARNRGFLS